MPKPDPGVLSGGVRLEPDFSDLSKIGIAYTHATDEDIPIQVNVDLVGYRVERYLSEVLIDERQYESLRS